VVVVGHSECGGVVACLNAVQRSSIGPDESITTIPSLSPDAPLNRWLDPLTKHLGSLQLSDMPREVALPIVVQENVKRQVEHVCKTQPMIDAWSNDNPKKRNVSVHGWVYDLASGRLRDLGISRGAAE
jgi:carbonic anhydrase